MPLYREKIATLFSIASSILLQTRKAQKVMAANKHGQPYPSEEKVPTPFLKPQNRAISKCKAKAAVPTRTSDGSLYFFLPR